MRLNQQDQQASRRQQSRLSLIKARNLSNNFAQIIESKFQKQFYS